MEFIRGEPGERGLEPVARAAAWVAAVIAFVSLLVLGAILLLVLPRFTSQVARTVATDPGKSIALGFALAMCVPAAAILALVTVIGIPLGVGLLLVYPVLLMLGYITVSMFLGDRLAAHIGKRSEGAPGLGLRVTGFAVSLAALVLVTLVPYVGWLALLLAVVAGLGAWSLRCWRAYAAPRAAVPA